MRVIYYTSANFMDSALETIQLIKKKHEVHLIIEVTPFSQHATIIQIESLAGKKLISKPEEVLSHDQMALFNSYFEGLASVHFVVHKNKRGFSPLSMINALKVGRFMRSIGFDIIHLDNISQRILALAPFLSKKKMIVTLHDPLPHTGEESWKIKVRDKYFISSASGFMFYSKFSRDTFVKLHPQVKAPSYAILLQPCSFMRHYLSTNTVPNHAVLFWGRLSTYKGIDILLHAIPLVLKRFPDQQFIIAGKPSFDFKMDDSLLRPIAKNVTFIPDYLSLSAVAALIQQSKFLVCPYRDATQSGVLTTAFALGKTAVVSDVGSFREYLENEVNGLIALPEPASFADSVISALEHDHYLALEKNVQVQYSDAKKKGLAATLDLAYENALNN